MAGWLRGLDFIKELTLIIISCFLKKGIFTACVLAMYTDKIDLNHCISYFQEIKFVKLIYS